jgi:sulfane dehydrogenase subunit SoxC
MGKQRDKSITISDADRVAGNGLLDRRLFLKGGAIALGGAGLSAVAGEAAAETLAVPPWMKTIGTPFNGYGQPSKFEAKVVRTFAAPANAPGTGSSRTPLHMLNGMITPNSLHFERSHNGVPAIDPDQHRLLIHGLVRRPLVFSLEALGRYPMVSRIAFVECAGNSGGLYGAQPAAANIQAIHGLLSCAEWTGVALSTLLDEAGVDTRAQWLVAEGADSAAMSRSIPLAKAMDDCIVALYQNGERVRPENGYPVRLLVPGYQGNMNVKWLRRIKLTETATMTKDETSKYSLLLEDGRVAQFKFQMDAKSVITHPSPGLSLKGGGLYEIAGLAWSGNGKVTKVEVSADGGKSWAVAALSEPVLSKALTRFRMPWRWDGGPATLQSRATDDTGYVQPTRQVILAARGAKPAYHNNMITTWGVENSGEVKHVYA